MFRMLFFLTLCAAAIPSAVDHGHRAKSPDVQVLEMTAQRENDLITIAARVKNTGLRPIRALNVIFRFADSSGTTLTTQRTRVDEAVLNPGEESLINAQMKDSPYAVNVVVLCETGEGSDLRVDNAGPFPVAQ